MKSMINGNKVKNSGEGNLSDGLMADSAICRNKKMIPSHFGGGGGGEAGRSMRSLALICSKRFPKQC